MFGLVFAQNIWSVLLLMVLIHSIATLFDPARQTAIKEYVPESQLIQANSLSQLSVQLSKVIAPTIGGGIVAVWSPSSAFIINSCCFFLSALLLSRLPKLTQAAINSNDLKEKKFFVELLSGLKHMVQSKYLVIAVSFMFSAMFLVFLYDSFIALWSKEIGLPTTMFSIILSGIGLGSIIGALIVGSLGNKLHPIRMILAIPIVTGLLFSIIGLGGMNVITLNAAGWFTIWMTIGIIGAGIPVAFGTIIQTETPANKMGKVYGSAQSVINIPIFIAPLLGAKLINSLGIGHVFLLAGSIFSVASLIALIIFEIDKKKNKYKDKTIVKNQAVSSSSSCS